MWLNNLRVVLPDRVLELGSVRIDQGKIAEINEGTVVDAEVDGSGLTLIPGLIDLHGDMLEREIEPRPGAPFPIDLALIELDKRMAGTGITTAFPALSFEWNEGDEKRSDTHTRRLIETINSLRDELLADTFVHGRFEVTNARVGPVLTELLDAGKIHLMSIMDHTPGQGQYRDVKQYVQFIIKWLGVNEEDISSELLYDRINARIAKQQTREWSWDVVHEAVEIAKARNATIASHDDDTAEKVERLAKLGVKISEFPVTLEAAHKARECGQFVVMGAPNALRGYSHSGNLSTREAIQAGIVDVLAVDYYPATLLQAPLKLAEEGLLPLHEAINMVSLNPAKAVGLTDRGKIEVGAKADLVLVETGPRNRVHGVLRDGLPIHWDRTMAERSGLVSTEKQTAT